MKELYEAQFSVVANPMARDWEVGDTIRQEMNNQRDGLVEQMKADGADPRHYKWTIHEFPMQEHNLSYRFHMTAERYPQVTIERIKGAGSNEV